MFYNGNQAGLQQIGEANLVPFASYCCESAQTKWIIADANGDAILPIWLNGRTELRIFKNPQGAY